MTTVVSVATSTVPVLDACRALHAAVHDPPRFMQTLPVFCASLFGLEGKAWLDDTSDETARAAVASVVGANSEVMRVLIEARGRPVLGWPAARLPPRLRALLVPAAQRPARVSVPSFIPPVVPPNAPHLPLDLFLYYFFAFMNYARNHNPYSATTTPTNSTTISPFSTPSFLTSASTTALVSTSPLAALTTMSSPSSWVELYLALWRQYLRVLLGGNSAVAVGLSGRSKSADGCFVEAAVELLLRGAETQLPGGAYVLPTVLHLQLLCLLVGSLVVPISSPSSNAAAANAPSTTSGIAVNSPSAGAGGAPPGTPSTRSQVNLTNTPSRGTIGYTPSSSSFSTSLRNMLPSSPSQFLARTPSQSPLVAAPGSSISVLMPPPGSSVNLVASSSTNVSSTSSSAFLPSSHPLLGLLPRPLYDFLSLAIANFALLPPGQLQLFVRLWRTYLLPAITAPTSIARRTYIHNNLAFYTTLLEAFLTSLHANTHMQPDARLLDQLGAVLADLLVGVFDSQELLSQLRIEESSLGPGAVPPPATVARMSSAQYTPLFAQPERHPQRAYFARLAALYHRERDVATALKMAFDLSDAEVGAVVRAGLPPSAPPPVEPEMGANGRLTERGAIQVRLGLRKCSPLNVPAARVPQWHRPIGSREWPFLVRFLYRIALLISKISGIPEDNIPLRWLASTEAHVLIAIFAIVAWFVWWIITAPPSQPHQRYRYREYDEYPR